MTSALLVAFGAVVAAVTGALAGALVGAVCGTRAAEQAVLLHKIAQAREHVRSSRERERRRRHGDAA